MGRCNAMTKLEGQQNITSNIMLASRPDRIVMLTGVVDEQSVSVVAGQLIALSSMDNSKPISLIISTYGGSANEMFGLYDVMKFLPCPIHTIGLGKIMSAGVLLLAAGKKGKRLIGENSSVMIHSASAECGGNIFDIINLTNELKRMQEQMVSLLAKNTKISHDKLNEMMKSKKDNYLTAQEAVNLGIADKVI